MEFGRLKANKQHVLDLKTDTVGTVFGVINDGR